MHRLLTARQASEVEYRATQECGITLAELMERAGAALARQVDARVPEGDVVICGGPGNNGGDGWVAARILHESGRTVRVLATTAPHDLSGLAASAASRAVDAGVAWIAPDVRELEALLATAAVAVDALLGTGSRLPLTPPITTWCDALNGALDAYVIAVDLPTGVASDGGATDPHAVQADCTVAFIGPKRGCVVGAGGRHSGEVVVDDLGVPASVRDVDDAPQVWSGEDYAKLLIRPAADAHKNARGRLLIVAGSGRYAGAAVLAARGAMRSGVGYVTLAVPEPIVPIAQAHLLAVPVVGLPAARNRSLSSGALSAVLDLALDHDAVVIGPGLTLSDGAVATVRGAISRLDRPMVIDADGLNALVDAGELISDRTAPTVLTPHAGELARLLGVSAEAIQGDRLSSSAKLADDVCTVVLKGAGTVISGAGQQVVNTSGSVALATAGTGDVLAGVVGALLAQGGSAFESGVLGAYLHGRAGDAAASVLTPYCVTAEDVPEYLPAAFAELLGVW